VGQILFSITDAEQCLFHDHEGLLVCADQKAFAISEWPASERFTRP